MNITFYANILSNAHIPLLNIHEVFEKEIYVWPDQFKKFSTLLQQIKEPIQELCRLLENTTKLPTAVIPHRYPLLMAVQNVEEQVLERNLTCYKYIDTSPPSSKRMQKKLREIKRHIDT